MLLLLTASAARTGHCAAQGGDTGAETCDFLAQRVNQEAGRGGGGEREGAAKEHRDRAFAGHFLPVLGPDMINSPNPHNSTGLRCCQLILWV